jgi:hypothetical protein
VGSADISSVERGISVAQVIARKASFDELTSADGHLFWVESDHDSAGRRLVGWSAETGQREIFPRKVDSALHAYGGGLYALDGSRIWAVDQVSCQIISSDGLASALGSGCDGDVSTGDGHVLFVRDLGVSDALMVVDPSTRAVVEVAQEAFLGSPRFAAGRLAWTQWSAAAMPWDACEVWTARLGPGGQLTQRHVVAGGAN